MYILYKVRKKLVPAAFFDEHGSTLFPDVPTHTYVMLYVFHGKTHNIYIYFENTVYYEENKKEVRNIKNIKL